MEKPEPWLGFAWELGSISWPVSSLHRWQVERVWTNTRRGGTGRAVLRLGLRQPLAFLLPSSIPLLPSPSCQCCSVPGDAGRPSSLLQTWGPRGWSPPGAARSPSAELQTRCGLATSHRHTTPEQRDRGRGLEDHAGATSCAWRRSQTSRLVCHLRGHATSLGQGEVSWDKPFFLSAFFFFFN